jgi:phosphatidylinositol alpha-mannosyltransferase
MKIGIVCPYDMDRPGGVQAHVRDIAAALAARGHAVRIVSPGAAGEAAEEGRLARFGRRRMIGFNRTRFEISLAWGAEARRLSAWLAAERFDVLHLHTPWDPFLPVQVLRRAGAAARVATFHDTPPDDFGGRMTRRLFRCLAPWFARRLDRVFAVSEGQFGHLVAPAGTELAALPPSIDLSRLLAQPRRPRGDGAVQVLFVGRLDARKGASLLLDAFARLRAEGLPLRLVVAGDGAEAAALAARARPEVRFAGRVTEEEKARLLAESDVFCAPSPGGESFGLVVVEAMAAGLPVVAAANAGYSRVLAARPECLVAPGDAAALADGLRRFAADAGLRAGLAAWGRGEAPRYDAAVWAERFEEIYTEAIRRRKTGMTTTRDRTGGGS